jgi:Mn-containing catalase
VSSTWICAATSPPRHGQRDERLINFCDDAGTKDALQFLMTREITHMKAFSAALESMKKPDNGSNGKAAVTRRYYGASTADPITDVSSN